MQLTPELKKAGAVVLDPSPLFFNGDGRALIEDAGCVLYHDSHHLTIEGTLRLKPLFAPVFARSGRGLPGWQVPVMPNKESF